VLDGLRLVAATMVVFYHFAGSPNADIGDRGKTDVAAWGTSAANLFPLYVHKAATYGWTGVELFFLISGFVICMSGWGRKPADFFVSRVTRLVPAYWAATILTAVVLTVFPRLTSGVRWSQVLTNLDMVQSAYGVHNLAPAYWTLFVELTFYLLFGLVAIGGITYRRMVTFCVLWSVASIAAASSHDAMIHLIINPKYSSYFIGGVAFFLIYKFGSNLLLWAIVAYSWLISMSQPHTNPPWEVTVIITAFYVIMGVVATHRLDRIRWRWLTLAGALTYPLYLIHQDLGFTVFTYLHGDLPAPELAVLTYLGLLGVAWLIHRLVERPVAPILKKRLTEAVNKVRWSGAEGAPAATGGAAAGGAAAVGAAAGGAAAGGAAAGGANLAGSGSGGVGSGGVGSNGGSPGGVGPDGPASRARAFWQEVSNGGRHSRPVVADPPAASDAAESSTLVPSAPGSGAPGSGAPGSGTPLYGAITSDATGPDSARPDSTGPGSGAPDSGEADFDRVGADAVASVGEPSRTPG
jgi:peptidoglycan/LPS O-acetylase OafA/YrhL